MYARPLVPAAFQVPARLDAPGFHLRMLTVNDLIKDYDAVMSSTEHLQGVMDPVDPWPRGMTLEEDLVDLGWHQREFTLRHSFAYTVMNPDESVCLGCCYLYPSDRAGYDAMAFYWVRASEAQTGLDARLGQAFRTWLATQWPFRQIAFPGRDIPWAEWAKG